jgi:hypothetical protein
VHQDGKKDYHYIKMYGKQNIKKNNGLVTSSVGILLNERKREKQK